MSATGWFAVRAPLSPRRKLILGIASSGVHSNGFSLVRKIVEQSGLGFDAQAPFSPVMTLGGALLRDVLESLQNDAKQELNDL